MLTNLSILCDVYKISPLLINEYKMTIFLEIAKHFLDPEIMKIHDASVVEDNGYVNTFLSFFNAGRNLELSGKKQQLLNTLKQAVQSLNDLGNDQETCAQLKTLITTCLDDTSYSRKQIKNHPEGNTDAKIEGLHALVDAIYKKLSELAVLDIKHDKDPINSFRYYMALYCAQKIINDRNANYIEHLSYNPNVSRARLLAAKKEELVIGNKEESHETPGKIQACINEVGCIKNDLANMDMKTNLIVIEFMRQFQLENLQLYVDHGLDLGVPVRLSFLSTQENLTKIQLGGGFLGECLRLATTEIQTNMAPLSVRQSVANV